MSMSVVALDAAVVPDPGGVGTPSCRGLHGLQRICVALSKHARISSRPLEGIDGDTVGNIDRTPDRRPLSRSVTLPVAVRDQA